MGSIVIISFLFLTSLNCIITYLCSTSALRVFELTKSYEKAVSKIRVYDKYLLTILTILTSAMYVVVSYFYFKDMLIVSDFFITLSLLTGFILSLATTVFSRLCYCYACNVLLKTTLSEKECFKENFLYLISIFFPLFLISYIISLINIIPEDVVNKQGLTTVVIFICLIVYFFTYPFKTIFTLNAKKITNKELKSGLDELFIRNDINRYRLYYWNSSKSNEANALVSGFFTYYLFVSTTLIESLNEREFESVVLHEIGHIKKHHFLKTLVYKLTFLIVMTTSIYYTIIYSNVNLLAIFILSFVAILVIGIISKSSKKNEEEADLFVSEKGYGNDLLMALKKIGADDNSINKVDAFFSNHPSVNKRIENLKDKEK